MKFFRTSGPLHDCQFEAPVPTLLIPPPVVDLNLVGDNERTNFWLLNEDVPGSIDLCIHEIFLIPNSNRGSQLDQLEGFNETKI
jgi:hypothetical protein